jgi:hypothetical protein
MKPVIFLRPSESVTVKGYRTTPVGATPGPGT